MIDRETKGSIVFISSIGGLQPMGMLGAYSVSKTALLGVAKCLSTELISSGIRVNVISPGIIKTKFSSALWEEENTREVATANIPMRRLGHPDEIAGGVLYLVSDDGSYVTGENLVISGGLAPRL